MAKSERIALRADPNDPEDGDVTEAGVAQALAEREERRRARGRPVGSLSSHKTKIALRIDDDVIAHFKGQGAGYQSRMNDALRKAAGL